MTTRTRTTKCEIAAVMLLGSWITGCGSDSSNTAATAAPSPVDASAVSASGTSTAATDTVATTSPSGSTTPSTSPAVTESPPEPVEKGKGLPADPFGTDNGNAGAPSLCGAAAPELKLVDSINNEDPKALNATYTNSKKQTFTITVSGDDETSLQQFLEKPMCLDVVPAKGLSGKSSDSMKHADVKEEIAGQAKDVLPPLDAAATEALESEIDGLLTDLETPADLGQGDRLISIEPKPVCNATICDDGIKVGDPATVYAVLDPTVAAGKYDTYSVKTTTYVSALVQSGRGTIFAAIRHSPDWAAKASGAASTGNYTPQMQIWQSPAAGGHFLSVYAYTSNPWVAFYNVWGTWQIESYGK